MSHDPPSRGECRVDGRPESSVVGCHDEIARKGDVHSKADRPPLHRGDDRRLTLLHRRHEAIDVPTHLSLGGACRGLSPPPPRNERSKPEQKCSPVPVMWITRTDSSDEAASTMSIRPSTMSSVKALRRSGRSKRTANTPPSCSTTRPSIAAGYDFIGSAISHNVYKMRLGVSRTDDHDTIRAATSVGHGQRSRGLARCLRRQAAPLFVLYDHGRTTKPGTRPSGLGDGRRNLAGCVRRPRSHRRAGQSHRGRDRATQPRTPQPPRTPQRHHHCSRSVPRNNVSASCRRSSATKNAGASFFPNPVLDLTSHRSR